MYSGGGSQHHDGVKKHSSQKTLMQFVTDTRLLVMTSIIVVLVIILFVVLVSKTAQSSSRSESYKKVTGAAGLNASIDYDCQKSCGQKYNFNVYIFEAGGQQVSVARPDKDGHVRLATAAGNYVMLIGKPIGKDGVFPQEKLTLKNGQQLDLTLHYKGGE